MATEIKLPEGLHEESETFLIKLKPFEKELALASTCEEMRKVSNDIYSIGKRVLEYDGTRDEMFVPCPEVPGGTPVYVYKPKSLKSNPAVLIYFHGGGLVFGDRESSDSTCRSLSSKAGCIVVNVEYRLAPEHKFPVMFDEGCAVAKWVLENRTSIGATKNSKVGVGGDSAGGLMSASVANDVPGLAFQVLIYPWVSAGPDNRLPSFREFIDGPVITDAFIRWMESQVVVKEEDWKNPRLVPVLQSKFDRSPPALFILAEFDPVRDDGYEYSKKLTAAGVHNELELISGAVHIFYTIPEHFVKLTEKAYEKTVDFIRRFGN